MKTFLRPAVIAAVMVYAASGQAGKPAGAEPVKPKVKLELPSGPLMAPAPGFAQWTVSFSSAEDAPKKPPLSDSATAPALGKMVTTKTRHIVHEEMTDIHDKHSDVWYVGPVLYKKPPGQDTWFESDGSKRRDGSLNDPTYYPFPANGFRDLDWISADSFAGILELDKSECLVFVPGGKSTLDLFNASEASAKAESQKTIAYIDFTTRLPVLVRINGEARKFEFHAAPAAMQNLPEDIAAQLKSGAESRDRLSQPAASPF